MSRDLFGLQDFKPPRPQERRRHRRPGHTGPSGDVPLHLRELRKGSARQVCSNPAVASQTETRRDLIILITPHIIDDLATQNPGTGNN